MNSNCQSINQFFLEYDVYDGRTFEIYELQDIFGRQITDTKLFEMCESTNLLSYKFLFNKIQE